MNKIDEFLDQSNRIEGYGRKELDESREAFRYLLSCEMLDRHTVLRTHRIFMRFLDPRIAGNFREVGVQVGGRVCPPHQNIPTLFGMWLMLDASDEESIKQNHIEFEKIHPFEDGNGRVGRMIMNWQRINAGLPILIIHVGEEQQAYYRWFDE